MADYIYLLQTRLTSAQQKALANVRDVARTRNLTVFLVGGAVRDLTSGAPIRDLDVVVQGAALKLRKDLEKIGGIVVGESETFQALHLHFAGGVRMEVGSALDIAYPKPGKPVAKAATILDDLRRRDFTANAMAISLNEGSYGLLMDPMNGVADIENRELRLVSNYGFIEDPSRMIRATRFMARLGWQMEERTRARYDNGKDENYIAAMNAAARGYETEEIIREEDPLRVLQRLESEGWMKQLFPAWSSAKANEAELSRMRDTMGQMNAMGIYPDPSAAYFPLMTAKMAPKDVAALKKSFGRPGFAKQIDALEAEGKAFGTQFTAKEFAAPSAAWKLLGTAVPESILWLAHNTKSAPVQARFKAYFSEWPTAKQKIPYTLMQEMRITPDLPGYDELVEKLFFAIMDGKLDSAEAAKAFLEPYSPPAPPPPVNMRRRAVKKEAKPAKSRSKKVAAAAAEEETDASAEAAVATPVKPAKVAAEAAPKKAAEKPVKAAAAPAKAATKAAAPGKAVVPAKKAAPAKVVAKAKPVATKAVVKKPAPKAKPVVKAAAKKAPAKVLKKAVVKTVVKKPAPKPAAKKTAVKVVAKKAAPAKKAAAPVKKSKPAVKGKRR